MLGDGLKERREMPATKDKCGICRRSIPDSWPRCSIETNAAIISSFRCDFVFLHPCLAMICTRPARLDPKVSIGLETNRTGWLTRVDPVLVENTEKPSAVCESVFCHGVLFSHPPSLAEARYESRSSRSLAKSSMSAALGQNLVQSKDS